MSPSGIESRESSKVDQMTCFNPALLAATGVPGGALPPSTGGPPVRKLIDVVAQRKACSAPCRGQLATLVAYRDARGEVKRYESPGSPGDCSHPPLLFFDERGEQTGAIPLVPVAPGSEQARKFDAIRQEQTAGLRRAEEISCQDVPGR